MRLVSLLVLAAAGSALAGPGSAQDLSAINNYRQYSPEFSSAGQPTPEQLELIKEAGFERVIYIAFSSDGSAFPNEDRLVRDLGMDYVHLPVVWTHPTASDFGAFASIMQQDPDKKTLLHCQVNFRASAFSFLYRVVHEGVSVAEAKADMNTVWHPNETWRDFIFDVLESNGISPNCQGCSWDVPEAE